MDANDLTHAYAEPGDLSLIDVIHPKTGLGVWSSETLDQVRQRYPRAELVLIADWQAAKAAVQDAPVTWEDTSEEEYFEMLEALPPAIMSRGLFAVGEPADHHALTGLPRYQAYRKTTASYQRASRPMTITELREVRS